MSRKKLVFRILITLMGIVAAHMIIIRYQPFCDFYRRIETSHRAVALTFDDGPNPPYTNNLLDVLDKHHVKATFFMVGKHIQEYPGVAKAVLEKKHEVGNHAYSHTPLIYRTPYFVRSEITKTDSILRDIGVTGEIYFRSPFGMNLFAVPYVLSKLNKTNINFDVIPKDWNTPDPELVARRVIESIQPGSIILLHDGGGPRQHTVDAVDIIIPELKKSGYSFVTISELFALSNEDHR